MAERSRAKWIVLLLTSLISSSVLLAAAPAKPAAANQKLADLELLVKPFVSAHLPELEPLLTRLRKDHSRTYEKAVRELAKAAKRVESVKSRSPQLYEIELQTLQAKTRINLLKAKMQVGDGAVKEAVLEVAVRRLFEADQRRLELAVTVAKERSDKARDQLELAEKRLANNRERAEQKIADYCKSLLPTKRKQAARTSKSNSSDSEPAKTTPKKKSQS